ncbi:MAG: chemotaxis protein CheX [Spartobacteria bacterium]|nr:chemotaxis protein CheX [Spartobacteria bacterium]
MSDRKITFEETMFTAIAAMQDTFKAYMNIDIYAGHVEKKVEPVSADVLGIVGIASDRVGYIIVAMDAEAAQFVARKLMMLDDPDSSMIRDAVGELTNTIAGAFKTKYHEQYGGVALGLPLIMSGSLVPIMEDPPARTNGDTAVELQSNGVVIPFKTLEDETTYEFRLVIYMQ